MLCQWEYINVCSCMIAQLSAYINAIFRPNPYAIANKCPVKLQKDYIIRRHSENRRTLNQCTLHQPDTGCLAKMVLIDLIQAVATANGPVILHHNRRYTLLTGTTGVTGQCQM